MKIMFFMIIIGGICYYWGRSNGLHDHCYHDWQMAPASRELSGGMMLWTCVKCHRTRIGL